MNRITTTLSALALALGGSIAAAAASPAAPSPTSAATASAPTARAPKAKVPTAKATRKAFKKLLRAAKAKNLKQTRKYTSSKKTARLAIKYRGYFQDSNVKRQKTYTNCGRINRTVACDYTAEQSLKSPAGLDIIQAMSARAKIGKNGKIVFTTFTYVNNWMS